MLEKKNDKETATRGSACADETSFAGSGNVTKAAAGTTLGLRGYLTYFHVTWQLT